MHLDMYALFEFNWKSSAESDVNSQIALSKYERGKDAKKHEWFLVSNVEFNFYVYLPFQSWFERN